MHDDGTIGYTSSAANNEFTRRQRVGALDRLPAQHLRMWALYQLPWGLSVSGAYFYGSGNRFASTVRARRTASRARTG